MLREIVKHEVRLSSTLTVNADLLFRCRLFSGGFVKSFIKNIIAVPYAECAVFFFCPSLLYFFSNVTPF